MSTVTISLLTFSIVYPVKPASLSEEVAEEVIAEVVHVAL